MWKMFLNKNLLSKTTIADKINETVLRNQTKLNRTIKL